MLSVKASLTIRLLVKSQGKVSNVNIYEKVFAKTFYNASILLMNTNITLC